MKLVVVGANGFVATEVIRQALHLPQITSLVALARKSVSVPDGDGQLHSDADRSKLHSIVNADYGTYSEDVRKAIADADGCIWTAAITPSKSGKFTMTEINTVNNDYPLLGVQTMASLRSRNDGTASPFRFVFMSGVAAERDQTATPKWMPEYALARGEGENILLRYAKTTNGDVDVCVAKPGIITDRGKLRFEVPPERIELMKTVPRVSVQECAAAMLDQIIRGFEMEPLMNDDLARIGQKVLEGKPWA